MLFYISHSSSAPTQSVSWILCYHSFVLSLTCFFFVICSLPTYNFLILKNFKPPEELKEYNEHLYTLHLDLLIVNLLPHWQNDMNKYIWSNVNCIKQYKVICIVELQPRTKILEGSGQMLIMVFAEWKE